MRYDFTGLCCTAKTPAEKKAAALFADEIEKRTGILPEIKEEPTAPCICFREDEGSLPDKDCYALEQNGSLLTVKAKGIRGFIFGYSYFLRKTEYCGEKITLIKNIGGIYLPDKKIRGHQVGYRTTPNTYDAWEYKDYYRYYLDMMAFGCNICEHIPYEGTKSNRNCLMKYDEEDFLVEATRLADELDMDVSLWHPNCDEETADEAVARREKLYAGIPRIDVIFPPGGDPGELYADEFTDRCKRISRVLKKSHPNAEMWPSAQAPHKYRDWGEAFVRELSKEPDEINGIIMGPNHAYPMHELRKKVPSKYPIRFYPDITHNVRCEYPVHFLEDDWHFAFASTISREGVNPRPSEFRTLHRIFAPYTVGGVSYSEGVHDDLNKMIWSDMEYFKECSLRESILDYARFFMPGIDPEKLCDGIFGLEKNWDCDPLESPCVKATYRIFCELLADYPFLSENWRFVLLYFRACCDEFVRQKRYFEENLVSEAKFLLSQYDISGAKAELSQELPEKTLALRKEIDELGGKLFALIGIQLDVERYHTNSWERGATLITIDNPVTDRLWLLNRIAYCEALPKDEQNGFAERLLGRNTVAPDEYYFSVCTHSLNVLGVRQNGEFYMNYQGDRPMVNNGSIPMSMLKVYDHFTFDCRLGGFTAGADYELKIIYKSKAPENSLHHKITANGNVIYDGPRFGGRKDEKYDKELLAPGFESAAYSLPASYFVNGTLELSISEPEDGFELCEFFIKRVK